MPAMETYRSCVEPVDCDSLGHMNVSRYFKAFSDAVANLQTAMGLTAQDMREGRKLSFAVVKMESLFHAEILAGESIYVKSEVKEIGTKSMTFIHRMYRAADDVLCFESTAKGALLSLELRKAVPVPEDVKEKAMQFMAD